VEAVARRRALVLGLALAAASPVVLCYAIIYYAAHQMGDIYASRSYMGARRWSLYALRLFRDYNELPHVLQQRLAPSFAMATKFLALRRGAAAAPLARLAMVAAASLLALILVAGLLNEAVPLYVTAGGRNLLWYATVLGAATGALRGATDDVAAVSISAADAQLAALAAVTHFLPRAWTVDAPTRRSAAVHDQLAALFPFRLQLFLAEVAAAATTPFLLLAVLPARLPAICAFLRSHTRHDAALGSLCSLAAEAVAGTADGGGATLADRPAAAAAAAVDATVKVHVSRAAFAAGEARTRPDATAAVAAAVADWMLPDGWAAIPMDASTSGAVAPTMARSGVLSLLLAPLRELRPVPTV